MTKGVRSQFLVKLHDLLETRAHQDGFRWTSETTFQIIATDKLAVAALQPAWKFTNLSSFIRQLNYYGFERMSDRRRSAERNGTSFNAGWIIFTHPSGFFRQGRPDLLDQIVRKSRKGKPDAVRPRSSVVAKVVATGISASPSPPISPTTSISSLSSVNSTQSSISSTSANPNCSMEFQKPLYIGAPDGALAVRRGMDATPAPYPPQQFVYPHPQYNGHYYSPYYNFSPTASCFNNATEGGPNSQDFNGSSFPRSNPAPSSYVSMPHYQQQFQNPFGYPSVTTQHPQSIENCHSTSSTASVLTPSTNTASRSYPTTEDMIRSFSQPKTAPSPVPARSMGGEEDQVEGGSHSSASSGSPVSVENEGGNKSTPPSTMSSPLLLSSNSIKPHQVQQTSTTTLPSIINFSQLNPSIGTNSDSIFNNLNSPSNFHWNPSSKVNTSSSSPFMTNGLYDPYLQLPKL